MQERVWGNAYRTTLVCVDTYDQGVPEGRLYNPYLPDGTRFHGLMEFLVKLLRRLLHRAKEQRRYHPSR